MSLNKETVRSIASLARIELTEAELDPMLAKTSKILEFVEQLSHVPTENIAPMSSVAQAVLSMREDAITDGDYQDKILANAPEREDGFFTVPKVVE